MEKRTYKKDEIIYKEGDVQLFISKILKGRIALYAKYNTSSEVFITEIEEGKVFGEMEMFESTPRVTTAIALEDGTEIMAVSYDEFGQVFKERPEKIMGILIALTKRTTKVLDEYKAACEVLYELENKKGESRLHLRSKIKRYASEYLAIQKLSSAFNAESTPLF